jgi:Flp pilus assembly pilin Flp
MEKTGGRWLVGAVGVIMIAVGVYFVVRGVRAKFRDELEPGDVGPFRHEWIVALGRVGWVGRGIVMALIGWFLARAAVRFRPEEAEGLDNALRNVTGSTAGALLVVFIAVALILYGAFCVISAPKQRLTNAD